MSNKMTDLRTFSPARHSLHFWLRVLTGFIELLSIELLSLLSDLLDLIAWPKYARIFVCGHYLLRKGFRQRSLKKTVSFEEQIMSKDKYPCIFLKPNGGYYHLNVFFLEPYLLGRFGRSVKHQNNFC